MSNTTQAVSGKDMAQIFAEFFHAYQECSPEVRAIVDEMSQILVDKESDELVREHASDVIMEALFPGWAADQVSCYGAMTKSEAFVQANEELKNQEATFAQNVKRLMDEMGMTQEELAKQAGITQPAVSQILKRECRPQQRTIQRFAAALGVAPEELWLRVDG